MDVTITQGFTQKTCKGCGVVFFIPDRLEKKFEEEGGYWYCPNGHQYGYQETEAAKYKRLYQKVSAERDQEASAKRDAIMIAEYTQQELEALKAKQKSKTKTKKKVKA